MCGIIGYIGHQKVLPVLIQGLERLEYRGYDSAGVACVDSRNGRLFFEKEKGKLAQLKSALDGKLLLPSHVGIGHTRWATHGAPSKVNAHPHEDCHRKIAVVHNGIIENYQEIKQELLGSGHRFRSETDTEVAVHLIEELNNGDLEEAFQEAVERLRGYFALVMLAADEPEKIFVFKRSNPMVLGVGKGENFVASDVTALIPHTRKVIYLDDDEFAVLTKDSIRVSSWKKKPIRKAISEVRWSVDEAKKGGFPHFMLKEIYEQPRVALETLTKRIHSGKVLFDTLNSKAESLFSRIRRIFVVSCGTAYHAGLVARYMFEEYVKVPTEVQVSSEFRYVDPLVTKHDLVILITQSGETADTLAALREAKSKGAHTLAVVNVVGSTIAREADYVIYTHAGSEIGVASTKAYIAQLLTLALFTIYLGNLRKSVSSVMAREYLKEIQKIPQMIGTILRREKILDAPARILFRKKSFLFLGRGYNFPTALEGALKLKEISYAHAHGYAAGEMKHGPIALIDSSQPVICLVPFSKTYEKMLSNIQEIKAREAIVLSIVTEGDETVKKLSDWVFSIPKVREIFSAVLSVIPLQLFAYKIAVKNKRDVDQPRNLAKSVTVE